MRLGGGGGDHLNSAIPQGDQKNFTHTVGGITKNSQNLKNFQRPLPIKNDTSLKAYCSSSNDVYKNSSISRKKQNGWETSHFPLRFSMTRSLTLFCRYFPVEHVLDGTRRGFFPTKDKLQIQRRVEEGICCTV